MGQQLNKIVKRTRRKKYLERKKALAKAGVSRKARAAKAEPKTDKKTAVKKPVAKKTAAKPKAAEVAAEATVPVSPPHTASPLHAQGQLDPAPSKENS